MLTLLRLGIDYKPGTLRRVRNRSHQPRFRRFRRWPVTAAMVLRRDQLVRQILWELRRSNP